MSAPATPASRNWRRLASRGSRPPPRSRWWRWRGPAMARVRDIAPQELPPDLAAIYREFAGSYGPFANQVAVFAHVPAALRHLMPLLLELRAAATLPKRALELA